MGRLSKTQNHKEGLKVNGPEGNHFSHGLIPSMKDHGMSFDKGNRPPPMRRRS